MRIMMFGDVIGRPGREAVARYLPGLAEEHRPDIVLANGENLAGGLGITRDTALPLFECGVDVITLGNHSWSQRSGEAFIANEPRVVRPANLPPGVPGRGCAVFETRSGTKIGVINLLGRVLMTPVDDPFRAAESAVQQIRGETPIILVDVHAEATSEKAALAWDLDGKVTAVVGTHTHVPTCDERVLPGGTAFVTDVGMVGPRNSILGVSPAIVIANLRLQMKPRIDVASGPAVVSGVVVEADDATGRAISISRFALSEQ